MAPESLSRQKRAEPAFVQEPALAPDSLLSNLRPVRAKPKESAPTTQTQTRVLTREGDPILFNHALEQMRGVCELVAKHAPAPRQD